MKKDMSKIFLVGPMGSGKTTIGKQLAKMLKLPFYDADLEIESRTGVAIAWIFDLEGEAGFRRRESQIIDTLTQEDKIILATGGGVILKPENRQFLMSRGYVIYLKVSLEEQFRRIEKSNNRPLLETDDRMTKLIKLAKEREPLYQEVADFSIDTDKLTISKILQNIVEHIQMK